MQQKLQPEAGLLRQRWLQILAGLLILLSFAPVAQAQVPAGTYTIASGQTYSTVAAAITAINAGISGNVVFNVGAANATNYTETFASATSGQITLTTNGSFTIIFQKNPASTAPNNPLITAATGTSSTTDAIIGLNGTDNVTFSGIDLKVTGVATEYGYALFKLSGNGSQNNTITGCTVTMDNTNANSVGIYVTNIVFSSGSASNASNAVGANSSNTITGNTITNVNTGIYLLGGTAAGFPDLSNSVGGVGAGTPGSGTTAPVVSATTGNNVTNFTGYGIRIRNQQSINIGNNNLDNSAAAVSTAAINGLVIESSSNATNISVTATFNKVALKFTGGIAVQGIQCAVAGTGTSILSNNTVSVTISTTSSSSSAPSLIANTGAIAALTVNGNACTYSINNTTGSNSLSGVVTGISNTVAIGGNASFSNNLLSMGALASGSSGNGTITNTWYGINNTGAISGTATFDGNGISYVPTIAHSKGFLAINNTGVIAGNQSISNNRWGIAAPGTAIASFNNTGASDLYFIFNSYNGSNDITVEANVWRNVANTSTASGSNTTAYGYVNAGTPTGGSQTFKSNNFAGLDFSSVAKVGFTGFSATAPLQIQTINNNIMQSAKSGATAGNVVYGISLVAGNTGSSIYGNTITGIVGGNNDTYGISTGTAFKGGSVYDNAVGDISTANAKPLYGMYLSSATGTTVTTYRNQIYNIHNDNTSTTTSNTVAGVVLNGSGATHNFYNNVVGNITIAKPSSTNAIIGLQVNATTANVYYNTVYLNASPAGSPSFGSSALYFDAGSTLDLRNTILVNNSDATAAGTAAVALRRSAIGAAGVRPSNLSVNSNNNLYYAGTLGVAHLLYAEDVTPSNPVQTIAAYKTFMGPTAEQASVTENPTFQNTGGGSAVFLHPSTSVGTQIESGGKVISTTGSPVAAVTVNDDYDTNTRQGSAGYTGTGTAPDIGADEDAFPGPTITTDVKPTALVTPASASTCRTSTETITVTINNNGNTALDFTTASLTVTVVVTKPDMTTQTFTEVVSSNSGNPTAGSPLAVGASRNVTITTGTLDMTAVGLYKFDVTATVPGDANTADALATQTRTVTAPTVGMAATSITSFCAGSSVSPVLTVSGVANGTLQWQQSSTGLAGSFTDISGAASSPYTVTPAITTTTYYQAVVRCTGLPTATSNLLTVTATSPAVGMASATPTSFCPSATPVLSVASYTGNLQWQVSSTGLAGSFTDISGATSSPYTVMMAITATTYYQAVVSCGMANVTSNIVMVTLTNPTVGMASAVAPYFCSSTMTTPVLSVTSFASGTLQWQSSTNAGGPFSNLTGGTTNPFTAPAISGTTYYQAVVTCGTSVTSNVVTVTPANPAITGTNTPVSRCGPGMVTLTATASAGTTINWYDTNAATTPLATGSSYSPMVTATRQFFVEGSTGGVTENAGRAAPGAGMTTNGSNSSGVVFDVRTSLTLKSVTVYPTNSGTLMVRLLDNAGAQITSASMAVTGNAAGTTPVVVTLNFSVPAGRGYRLLTGTSNSVSMEREAGTTFPIISASEVVSVTSGFNSSNPNTTYYYFYNFVVQSATCTSGRLPVDVIVNPLPTATLTAGGSCVGNASTVSVAFPTGTAPYTFDYTVDGVAQPQVTTSSNPYVITTPVLTVASTYTLTSLSDAQCTATPAAVTAATVTITPSSTTTFTGAVSSDWNDAGNWTNCIPTAIISAIIPASKSATLASGTATANDLTIQGSGTLTITGATAMLVIKGDLSTASGSSLTATAGTTMFDGTAGQAVAAATYYNLALSGSTAKMLSGDISVGGTFDLSNGMLDSNGHVLTLTSTTSTFSGTNASHYVLTNGSTGRVAVAAIGTTGRSGSVVFPVGTATSYTPAKLFNAGTNDMYSVTVGDGISRQGMPVTSHVVNKTWDVSEGTAGGSNVTLALQWNAGDETSGFDRSRVAVAHYENSQWNLACATCFTSATGGGPYTVSRSGISTFSPFGVEDDSKPLPVELTRFEAARQGANAELSWTTASEKDNTGFAVQVSTDGKLFRELAFVEATAGKNSGPRSYAYTDRESVKAGLRYYRLRQVDRDGTASFSPVRTVQFGTATEASLSAAPNPFGGELSVTVTLRVAAPNAYLLLTDALGRTVQQQPLNLGAGSSTVILDALGSLPNGVYLLRLDTGATLQHLKVVKQ